MGTILKVLVPEATENYVENPSFRYNTFGWTAVGSTLTRVLTYKLYGIASLKVVTDGLAINEGVYYRVSDIAGGAKLNNEPVTVSAYVRGAGRIRIRFTAGPMGEWSSDAISLSATRWKRLEVTGTLQTQYNDVRMYIETDATADATTFYVDGGQMERKSYSTTFCDGEQPGCRWNITDSYSNPTRNAYTREGGRWVELISPCRENDDIYTTVLGGFGMPPLQHNIQPWALSPGSYFQNSKVLDRSMTIMFNVKREHKQIVNNVDISPLHEMRQQLVDIFKTDKTAGNEPFWFSFQEGARELFIRMRYEAGLEGNWDIRNQWINSFPVRFLIVDPYWVENNAYIQALNFKQTHAFSHIAGRVDGEWKNLDDGLNDVSHVAVKGKYGEVFVGGDFTKDKLNTVTLNNFAQWSGDEWNNMGAFDATIEDICITPAGNVYVTGAFHSVTWDLAGVIGLATVYSVAKGHFIPGDNTLTWESLGTTDTASDIGYAICSTPDNGVFVGGHFTGTFGLGNPHNIARWDNLSWDTVGAGPGFDGDVYDIAYNPNTDKMYICGNFLKNFGAATNDLNYIGEYDYKTDIVSAMGSGFNATVTAVEVSPAGYVYAVGTFTASGTTALNHIARWNGSVWEPLGGGVTGTFLEIKVVTDQFIIVTGNITAAEDLEVHHMVYWNGTNWVTPDIEFNSDILDKSLVIGEDIYVCGDIDPTTTCNYAAINEVTNYGTAETFPIIYIDGPGHLTWIENQTTKKKVYLDLEIHDNEEVFIDFGRKKIYSSLRENLLYTVVRGSDFNDFSLIPGVNKIAIFMTHDVASAMYMYYQPRHWSGDATVDAEELT